MHEKVLPTPLTEGKVFLQNMFDYFQNGTYNSPQAKEYILKRGLDAKKTEVGYNTGQFHHGARKEEQLIQDSLAYGLLLDKNMTSRTGERAYGVFGKGCIVFALRDVDGEIVSLYFRSTSNDKEQRHYYLRERQGLYPGYPSVTGKKLIITESVIDAATLLEQESIKSNYEILALFGTNGLTSEHQNAIKKMTLPSSGGVGGGLEEIIFFLNGDEAGRKAVQKYAPQLQAEYPLGRVYRWSVAFASFLYCVGCADNGGKVK